MLGAFISDVEACGEVYSALCAGGVDPQPEVYLTPLAGGGGAWFDAAQRPEMLAAEVAAFLDGAESYRLRAWRGFGSLRLSERAPLEDISRLANAVCRYGAALISALAARFADPASPFDHDAALAALADYAGAFDSLADFAGESLAARLDGAATLHPAADLSRLGAGTVERGDAFAIRLGRDLHMFWTV